MNVLLDTHFLIWALYDHKRLPEALIELLTDRNTCAEYSIISLWETEIKHIKHPDDFVFSAEELRKDAQAVGLHMLDLEPEHIMGLHMLKAPVNLKHNDPFDRMLIAQAKAENIVLITHDSRLSAYGEECVAFI